MILPSRNIWNLNEHFKLKVPLEISHSFYRYLSLFSLAWKRIYAYGDTSESIKQEEKNPRKWGTPASSKERAKLAWYAKAFSAQQGSLCSFAGFGLLCSCARHRSVFWQMRMWVEVMCHFSFRTYKSECASYSFPLLQQIQKSCGDRKHDKMEETWIIELPNGKGHTPKLGWITFIVLSYQDLGVCCDS